MDDKQQTKHYTILSYMFIGEVLSFCSQRFYCKYSNMPKPKLQKKSTDKRGNNNRAYQYYDI